MSKTILAKLIVISSILISFSHPVNAKKVECYIITNNNDTIYGTIQVSRINSFQGTISLSSYNMEELFYHLYFKSPTDKKFNELTPKDIQEYGFILERTHYRYISKEVTATWGNNKRKFYLQIAKGAIDLFETRTLINSQERMSNSYGMPITEYYIIGEDKNLILVSRNDKDEPVSDFLTKNLKLDKEILDKVVKDKTFKDIKEIVGLYNAYFENAAKP